MQFLKLPAEPFIGLNVELTKTVLGAYTQIGDNSILNEVDFGDYSYCAGYNQMDYTSIGKFCSIATFVRINPGNHPAHMRVAQHHFTYRSSQYGFGEDDEAFFDWRRSKKVIIGNDVWIGHNACIMPGVTVGDGAVIGTGAVVTKDVEPYSIVAGVPAKKINMRFTDDIIEKLIKLQWWNWSHDVIAERLLAFRNIDDFIAEYL